MSRLVIATDLDGTFLEGDKRLKNAFYSEFMNQRETVLLIYTTGRSLETVKQFCDCGYLPPPHFVIADHGTVIADGTDFRTVSLLQEPIVRQWNNGNIPLRKLMKNEKGVTIQPIHPPYRVAYYYDPEHFQEQTLQKIVNAGFDYIQSCDMYLDIVPKGVNKGSSLMNILAYLNIDKERVITCGDSLNDFSLFQTGLRGIAVGNSEPKLIAEVQRLTNVYCSRFNGLAGIIDGLQFYQETRFFNPALWEASRPAFS